MTPLSAPPPSTASVLPGCPVSGATPETGGFAAILGGTEAAMTSDVGDGAEVSTAGSAIEMAQAISITAMNGKATGKIGGKPGGKELPATALADLPVAPETPASADGEKPADTALTDVQPLAFDPSAAAALMTTLAFIPARPAETAPAADASGTDLQAAISPSVAPVSTLFAAAPVQTSLAAPIATTATPADTPAIAPTIAPAPETVAPPTVRLAPVELVALDPATPSAGTNGVIAATTAPRVADAAEAAPATLLQAQAAQAIKTALAPQGVPASPIAADVPPSPRSASVESTPDTATPVPLQRPVAKVAEIDSPVQVAATALPESTVAIPNAVPLAAATVTSANIASVQTAESPQDFATLVGKLSEAREAASPHLVRTAVTHTEFGAVSLQFRPEGGGLSVTMANVDPAFAGAVHAGLAASFAGGDSAGTGSGDTARNDARQAWQQQPSSNSAQNASNQFGQDQRQSSSQPAANQQDGERRGAGSTSARASTETDALANGAPKVATPKPGRSGIYA